ncbi:MAG: DUF4405 domain-containing protein [Chloroflexaceae bacterium]|nr:DUF4405 domain-containing protein [Chloroflexaceae bacterium]
MMINKTTSRANKRSSGRKMRINLVLDIALLLMLLLLYEPRATGMMVHEWLGVVIGSVLVVHLLLHWDWLVAVTRRFLGKTSAQARLNYVLGALLFVAFTAILVSGLMLSKVLLPMVGLAAVGGGFWHWLHGFAADMTFWLVALHVALHWKWFVALVRRPFQRSLRQPAPTEQAGTSSTV